MINTNATDIIKKKGVENESSGSTTINDVELGRIHELSNK